MSTIGIDLGTTYSCVASFIPQSDQVEVISNNYGNNTTPSYVAIKEDEIVVGEAAQSAAVREPQKTIYDIKRLIGLSLSSPKIQEYSKLWPFKLTEINGEVRAVVDGKTYSTGFISSQILRHLKEQADTFLGTDVKKAVVTIPAYFNEVQKAVTKYACENAGLEILQLITEPTAAAIAYYCQHPPTTQGQEKNCLIFDLGGGTFDIAFVTFKDGKIQINKIAGDSNLGGEDFDNAMVEYCLEEFKRKHGIDLRSSNSLEDEAAVAKTLRRIKMECQKQKCYLSATVKRVPVSLDAIHGEIDLHVFVTKEKFEELNEDKFQRCLEIVKESMAEAGLKKEDIDDIVLVGGSSRIPRVQDNLKEYFGKGLKKNINEDEAVAYGAAMQAHFLVNPQCNDGQLFRPVIEHLNSGFPTDNNIFALSSPIGSSTSEHENSAEEILRLQREINEVKAKAVLEIENLRKVLSEKTESRDKERCDEILDADELLCNIPIGLLDTKSTLIVKIRNVTKSTLETPLKWGCSGNSQDYFHMPTEIPQLTETGFSYAAFNLEWNRLCTLFSYQIGTKRFVVRCYCGFFFVDFALAFVPPDITLDHTLFLSMMLSNEVFNSDEKKKIFKHGKTENEEMIEATLEFGDFRIHASMAMGTCSIITVSLFDA